MSTHCGWCEYVATCADLVGFIGALFLAYPFLFGQRVRDEASAVEAVKTRDPLDQAEFAQTAMELRREILNRVRREYRAAWIGALLIAGAFVGKFVSALPSLDWYSSN
jgi:hypothetical protein